jgi:phthiocerol/phenolphthiocerol synthesis type-I polyketide synthase E
MSHEPAAGWNGTEVAIIGMAGRFPGARDVEELWRNLCAGVESISRLSEDEIEPHTLGELPRDSPQFVPAASCLAGVELFDAEFFGYTPSEAEIIDPQQRLFLECAWEALEQAGYNPESCPGAVGVFAGARTNTYLFNLFANRAALAGVDPFQVGLGNDLAFLASRLSYRLNLRGPSYGVHTACSTGLVAVHLARQSLLLDECRMALAGGVAVNVPQRTGYLFQPGGVASPDGHTRAFDEEARGTIFGSGIGVVVLKRLEDALADGDTLRAVLRGSATNNDGNRKASFTAPSVYGQSEVILDALADARIAADTIRYVEAHGTGTQLGDPIEVRALARAFAASTSRRGFCALGSVKTNLGHLDAAAGVVSLIKTVLALERRQIPPSLHYRRPNPRIDFAATPFYVNDRLAAWEEGPVPRRAAVSSFGIGGTNAHVVLEEAPAAVVDAAASPRPWQLLVLSARSEAALDAVTARLADHLEAQPRVDLGAVAFTLLAGRKGFACRRAAVCRDAADAVATLRGADPSRLHDELLEEGERPLAFLFTGQGGRLAGAGAGLYRSEEAFRDELDRLALAALPALGADLRTALLDPAGEAAAGLAATRLAQPALVVLELALARLLDSWGLRPAAVLGHSVGELAAACAAGVLGVEDALALAIERGRLMQACPGGAMLAVSLPPEPLRELLAAAGGGLEIAACNAPDLTVAAGPAAAVERLAGELERRGIERRRLATSHAFHTAAMAAAIEPMASQAAGVRLSAPAVRWVSSVTGTWVEPSQATDPAYWGSQLRQPVRFADAAATLLADPALTFLEVGPGAALTRLLRRHPACARHRAVVPALPVVDPLDPRAERRELLRGLGRLWAAGVELDGRMFAAAERRRVPLPTYPFERKRYWIEPGAEGPGEIAAAAGPARATGLAGKRPDVADWFHVPAWVRSVPPPRRAPAAETAAVSLVFLDDGGLGKRVAAELAAAGDRVVRVAAGPGFARTAADSYTLDPGSAAEHQALFEELRSRGKLPARIAHLFSLTGSGGRRSGGNSGNGGNRPEPPAGRAPNAGAAGASEAPRGRGSESFDLLQRRGYYSLLFAAQALLAADPDGGPVRIAVIADQLFEVAAGDRVEPAKATLLGPCRVLPQENPRLTLLPIDVTLPSSGPPGGDGADPAAELAAHLAAELGAGEPELGLAYRGGRRFVQLLMPLRLDPPQPRPDPAPRPDPPRPDPLLRPDLSPWPDPSAQLAPPAQPDPSARPDPSPRPDPAPRADPAPRPDQASRFDPAPQPDDKPAGDETAPPWRERGVYLITGGLGGVGLLLAAELAARCRARLVLTARSPLPPRGAWESSIAADPAAPLAERLRRLLAIEAAGAELLVVAADVADEAAMRDLLAAAEARFGALHGVIHAAGITAGPSLYRPAVEIGVEESEAQFQPKARGTYVLERLLAGRRLDFAVLVSSNAASLGGLGYVAYAAANAFLDAFAASRAGSGGRRWLSSGWDPWPEETKTHGHGVATGLDRYAMTRDESVEAFRRLAGSGLDGAVAVVTGDLAPRLARWVHRRESEPASGGKHERPRLRSAYVAPRDETETAIAAIWQEVLGIGQVGITDSFFDLGGHSLLATRLVARLRERLGAEISLQTFFEAPTVQGLAEALAAASQPPPEDDPARRILAQLMALTEEEAEEQLTRLDQEVEAQDATA